MGARRRTLHRTLRPSHTNFFATHLRPRSDLRPPPLLVLWARSAPLSTPVWFCPACLCTRRRLARAASSASCHARRPAQAAIVLSSSRPSALLPSHVLDHHASLPVATADRRVTRGMRADKDRRVREGEDIPVPWTKDAPADVHEARAVPSPPLRVWNSRHGMDTAVRETWRLDNVSAEWANERAGRYDAHAGASEGMGGRDMGMETARKVAATEMATASYARPQHAHTRTLVLRSIIPQDGPPRSCHYRRPSPASPPPLTTLRARPPARTIVAHTLRASAHDRPPSSVDAPYVPVPVPARRRPVPLPSA